MVRERRVVEAVISYLNGLPHARARKVHGGAHGPAGEPDVDACVAGRAVKVEVKAPGAAGATRLQRRRLEQWAEAGAVVGEVRSVEDVRALLMAEGLLGGVAGDAACCEGHAAGRLGMLEGCDG